MDLILQYQLDRLCVVQAGPAFLRDRCLDYIVDGYVVSVEVLCGLLEDWLVLRHCEEWL